MKAYKVGLGFDVHKFSRKKKDLILGGAKIPYRYGLEAVSDADVVLHAISDALCGCVALGDIGDYFPPHAKKSKGICSLKIAETILAKTKKFKIINIDTVIVAQKPRLAPYKGKILSSLKNIFSADQINLKIKSKENLEILGGKNAIACFAIALLRRK